MLAVIRRLVHTNYTRFMFRVNKGLNVLQYLIVSYFLAFLFLFFIFRSHILYCHWRDSYMSVLRLMKFDYHLLCHLFFSWKQPRLGCFTLLLVSTFWAICYERLHVDMFSSYVMIEFYTGNLKRNGSSSPNFSPLIQVFPVNTRRSKGATCFLLFVTSNCRHTRVFRPIWPRSLSLSLNGLFSRLR